MALLSSVVKEDTSLNVRESIKITVVTSVLPDTVLLEVDGVPKRMFQRKPNTSTWELLLFGLEMTPGIHALTVVAFKASTVEVETLSAGSVTLLDNTYVIPADMVEALIRAGWDSTSYGDIPNIIKTYEQKSFDTELEGAYIILQQGTTSRKHHAQRNYVTEIAPVTVMIRCSGMDDEGESRAYTLYRGVLNSLEHEWNNIPFHLWGYLLFEDSGANESDNLMKVWSFTIRTALVDEWRRVGIPQ